MRIPIRTALLAMTLAALAGCSTLSILRLEPGKSTEADVRRAFGEPALAFPAVDGTRQLVFAGGPQGAPPYVAHISANGSLARLEQVSVESQSLRFVPGTTTAAEVERLIGPPWRKVDFPNKRAVAWDYVYQDTWDYTVDLAIMVDARGIVVETVHARRSRGDAGHD